MESKGKRYEEKYDCDSSLTNPTAAFLDYA
jgi:hypothetical protein